MCVCQLHLLYALTLSCYVLPRAITTHHLMRSPRTTHMITLPCLVQLWAYHHIPPLILGAAVGSVRYVMVPCLAAALGSRRRAQSWRAAWTAGFVLALSHWLLCPESPHPIVDYVDSMTHDYDPSHSSLLVESQSGSLGRFGGWFPPAAFPGSLWSRCSAPISGSSTQGIATWCCTLRYIYIYGGLLPGAAHLGIYIYIYIYIWRIATWCCTRLCADTS